MLEYFACASLDGTMLVELASGVEKKLKVTDFPQICFLTTLWLKQGQVRVKDSQLLHFFGPVHTQPE